MIVDTCTIVLLFYNTTFPNTYPNSAHCTLSVCLYHLVLYTVQSTIDLGVYKSEAPQQLKCFVLYK